MLDAPPILDCPMYEVLAALAGEAPAHDPRVLTPPPSLDGRPTAPPAAGAKALYGGHLAWYEDTANFTINWEDPSIDPDAVSLAATALETVWRRMVEEDGWRAPVSSDRYLLWIILDPQLGGTGFTTEYFTSAYPDGYPVIYLNPAWASSRDFFTSLCYHEFHHALQYALRDYTGAASEAWYWEASAEWGNELTDPELDGSIYTVAWYAEAPELAHDTMNAAHEYGMQVLNAWIDELGYGPGGMQAVWSAADGNGRPWLELLAETLDLQPAEIWAGMTSAMGNNLLANSRGYANVRTQGTLAKGSAGEAEELGTRYFRVGERLQVRVEDVEGRHILAGRSAQGVEIVVDAGDILAVTATSEGGGSFILHVGEAPEPVDDTGGLVEDTDPGGTFHPPPKDEAVCGCGTARPSGLLGALSGLLSLLAALREPRGRPARPAARRRPSPRTIAP
jgi:hypothetical protein